MMRRVTSVEKLARNARDVAAALRGGPTARRDLRRRYTYSALGHAVPFVGVETPDGVVFVSTADRTVGRSVFMRGSWEPDLLPRAVELAGCAAALGDGTFVEVGANIGTTTLPASRLARRVIAVEPSPGNVRLLRATLAANEIGNVDVVEAACSDEPGYGWLELSPVNWGDHRVSGTGDVRVPLCPLDDILDGAGVDTGDVALVWVDTQGHEAHVLAGAGKLLAALSPLLIEWWPSALGGTATDLLGMLAPYGRCVDMGTGSTVTDRASLITEYADGATDLLLTAG